MTEKNKNLTLDVCTYVIQLISSVINNTIPPENTASLDWEKIIEFAKQHCVLNIVSYATLNLKNKPDDYTMKFLQEFKMQKIIVEAQQEIELQDALQKLSIMQVKHIPLKGCLIKNLYPSPDMRTMGDLDILVESDRCNEVVAEFEKDGFSFSGEGELHSNVERGNAYIEFHRSMVDEQYGRLYDYFGNGFLKAKPSVDDKYRYELSNEDVYIFLIAHIAKHFRNGGTGIRSLLDLRVFRKAYPDLDMKYIKAEMKKIGLEKFQNKIETIAGDWFKGNFDGEYNDVSEYIALSGVFGQKENAKFSTFILENNEDQSTFKTNRLRWIVREFFPKSEVMAIRYPVLKRQKWLTPLFWIVRVFDTLIHEPKNAKGRLVDSIDIMKIDTDVVNVQNDVGIDEL